MPKLFGIDGEKLKCVIAASKDGEPITAQTLKNILIPIESEKKEEYTKRPMGLIPIEDNRCTKCNTCGTVPCDECMEKVYGHVMKLNYDVCFGKEPRKEECSACKNPPDDTYHTCLEEPRKDTMTVSAHIYADVVDMWQEAEAKLSRYKEALEVVANSTPPHTHKELQVIARTALEDTNH